MGISDKVQAIGAVIILGQSAIIGLLSWQLNSTSALLIECTHVLQEAKMQLDDEENPFVLKRVSPDTLPKFVEPTLRPWNEM